MYDHITYTIVSGVFKDGESDSSVLSDFKIRYSNGDIYEGSILNMQRNGKGKMYSNLSHEDVYEGEWKADKRDG